MAGISNNADLADVVNREYLSTKLTVGTTQVLAKAGASNLAERQELVVYNAGVVPIFYGPSGVATSGANAGIPIQPNGIANLQVGDAINIYLIADSSNTEIIVQELS